MTPRSMLGSITGAAIALTLNAIASGAGAADDPPEKGGPSGAPEKLPKCVDVRSEARYSGYGYDHIIEIENRCDKSVSCTVATDVNPQAQSISVNAGEKRSVLTFRGSPASAFKPDVTCKLAS